MIPILFNILFFIIPLIFYKGTSELFEFNKIVTLYAFTALIVSAWAIQSIRIKRFIFRKTILDWPLIIYLTIYLFSSLLSIDPHTSMLGYYSRFNGGLISQICYALLYWSFVSHMSAKQSLYAIRYSLISIAIASTMAVGERFGIFTTCGIMGFSYTNSCWVQDVQNRVFSTLGQPNWLAAVLVALVPFTWIKSWKNYLLSILFFVTLLFTKSRSGLLAFGVEAVIFWGFVFLKEKNKYLKEFIFIFLSFSFLAFLIWFRPAANNQQPTTVAAPVLESGGTESGTIRKYVWLGAWEVFKHYPILGTGPETFAFSFPIYRPVEHNLTSEWDFIYNKAHNEFLNYLANTGILGFSSYVALIIFSIIQIIKNFKTPKLEDSKQVKNKKLEILNLNLFGSLDFFQFGIFAGYISILITNFFGFSVVPVSLLFFLFPAVAVASSAEGTAFSYDARKTNFNQKLLIILVLLTTLYTLYAIRLYWLADIYFNKNEVEKALKISPDEPYFVSKMALIDNSAETALKAFNLNTYNQNSRRILVSNLVKNAGENPESLLIAEKVLLDGTTKSPNDPKLYYQLGILQLKLGKNNEAISSLEKTIELKPNYKEGRFGLGATYKALNEKTKAKEQFEYILKNIDPNDDLTKKYLEEII